MNISTAAESCSGAFSLAFFSLLLYYDNMKIMRKFIYYLLNLQGATNP